MSFPNVYTHRKVADTAAKSCEICYKLTTSVLFNPESKDFFYVCPVHLKDRRFCSPIIDQAAVEARKKKELEEEVERVRKEYEEKQRKKEKEKEAKEKEKGKEKDSKEEAKEKKDDKADEKKTEGKTEEKTPPKEEEPRIFSLHRTFYQQRIDKKRQVEMAKRNRERLQNPNYFPSVPKGLP